ASLLAEGSPMSTTVTVSPASLPAQISIRSQSQRASRSLTFVQVRVIVERWGSDSPFRHSPLHRFASSSHPEGKIYRSAHSTRYFEVLSNEVILVAPEENTSLVRENLVLLRIHRETYERSSLTSPELPGHISQYE